MKKIMVLLLICCGITFSEISVQRDEGGSNIINLGYGMKLNEGSTILREWITINNSELPIELRGKVPLYIEYEMDKYSGDYYYITNFLIKPTVDMSAVEVNIITFNLWGKKVNNLSMTEIKDLKMGKTYDLDAKWKIYSEHEASEFYASIAYISQIRTIDGRILQPNPNDIVKVAKSISSEFTQSDLIIDRDKK